MVSAMGTAGLTATFNVFDAEGNNIVTDGSLTEDAETAGSYSGSFEVVVDAHPTGDLLGVRHYRSSQHDG